LNIKELGQLLVLKYTSTLDPHGDLSILPTM